MIILRKDSIRTLSVFITLSMVLQSDGCISFKRPRIPSPRTTTPPTTTTPRPLCEDGDMMGYHSCSFICGLNDQWYPRSSFTGDVSGAPNCTQKGTVVEGTCPLVCVQGQYLPTPCYRCCEDYSNNHCDITCDIGLSLPYDCDPFNPPTTKMTTTPTRPSTTTLARPPTTTTQPPQCQEGDQIGYHSCSFICGLNGQWYPERYGGGHIPGAQRCSQKGQVVEATCPLICVQGQYLPVPCYRCCQDYSNNHCDITCDTGLYIPGNCDPFNPTTTSVSPPTTTPARPPTTTTRPQCQEGDQLGYHSCSFICGLNDQWYPRSYFTGDVSGAPNCTQKGTVVEGTCPLVCVQGQYLPTPCFRCCEDYSNNHCDITCEFGLSLSYDCDPFNPTTTKMTTTPTRPPTTTPARPPTTTTQPPQCQEGDQIGYHSCSFICGLNGQWYPERYGGGHIPGAQRCSQKGQVVEATCPLICVQGQYLPVPCYRCCQDYSNNHCDITCDTGLYIPGNCDPFNPTTTSVSPPTTTPARPPTTTTRPQCQEGDQLGYHSCSFICGLNDQWYPRSSFTGDVSGAPNCTQKGTVVEGTCPLICQQGHYLPTPCYRCCEDYPNNHCDITCEFGLPDSYGCDPFNPPTTKMTTTPTRPPTTTPARPPTTTTQPPQCQEGDQIGYHSCSFICGLNDQWYPRRYSGGIVPEASNCTYKGSLVEANCPLVCVQGQYLPAPCYRCCEDYSDNHCEISCGQGETGIQIHGCDPFNPPRIPTTTPRPSSISTARITSTNPTEV